MSIVADELPAFKLISISTNRLSKFTKSRSSAGVLALHTCMPFSFTSTFNGSKFASAVPVAAKTRPQLGSPPKMAHFKRLFRAFALPTLTASSSDAAFITLIATVLDDPSASAIS